MYDKHASRQYVLGYQRTIRYETSCHCLSLNMRTTDNWFTLKRETRQGDDFEAATATWSNRLNDISVSVRTLKIHVACKNLQWNWFVFEMFKCNKLIVQWGFNVGLFNELATNDFNYEYLNTPLVMISSVQWYRNFALILCPHSTRACHDFSRTYSKTRVKWTQKH